MSASSGHNISRGACYGATLLCSQFLFLFSFHHHYVQVPLAESTLQQRPYKGLVVYNAVGKSENLKLVEHSRSFLFRQTNWDCLIFMYVGENVIPHDSSTLNRLKTDFSCSVVRIPGMHWGIFLQYINPLLVSSYDYIGLILDDIFFAHKGPNAVDVTLLIELMEKHQLGSIQPGIIGDDHGALKTALDNRMGSCLVGVPIIETFAQIFTLEIWECYYKMLHHTGGRGWCYDSCMSKICPDHRLARDMRMRAWHMKHMQNASALPDYLTANTSVHDWKQEDNVVEFGFWRGSSAEKLAICHRNGCNEDWNHSMWQIDCSGD